VKPDFEMMGSKGSLTFWGTKQAGEKWGEPLSAPGDVEGGCEIGVVGV